MKVLIVDDDRTLADLLSFTFRRAGYETIQAFDAPGAIESFEQEPVDIILLDVNLPGEAQLRDGFDVCKAIRQTSNVPIILLTVRDDEDDIVKGLNIGADDYVLKPFSPRQLVARVQTVLRRAKEGQVLTSATFSANGLQFDPNRHEFTRSGSDPVTLTRLESRLMEVFFLNPNQVLPTANIIDHVWGPESATPEMLRQLIRRLRQKVETDPGNPQQIHNHPGIGYRFSP
jgi:DNA-binding response OmpR family regulator